MPQRPRRARRPATTLIVLILISIAVISFDEAGKTHDAVSGFRSFASDAFSPIRSGVNDIISPLGHFFAGAVHYGSLQRENQKLQNQISTLQMQLSENTDHPSALQQLEQLDHIPFLTGDSSVVAAEVNVSSSDFAATITIDKGRSAGVTLGDPVVGGGGLVGQVVQANHATAIVRLITDGQSKVSVTFGGGEVATVNGVGPGRAMAADFVSSNDAITVGEKMYTDNLTGATFPAGIPVAKVTSAKKIPGADQQEVVASPLANLDQLTYVEVVQWSPSP